MTSATGVPPTRVRGAATRPAAASRNCLRSMQGLRWGGVITSRDNPKLRLVQRLHGRAQRRRTGLFVCEGEDLVDAALAAGLVPVELLRAGEDVEPELLAEVSALGHPPRVVGVFRAGDLPAVRASGRSGSRSGTWPIPATSAR